MSNVNENQNTEVNKEEEAAERSLSFFMPGKVEEAKEIEQVVSTRIKDDKDKPVKFVFKPLTTERVEEIEKECKKNVRVKGRVVGKETDQARFMARLAVETTVYPNFKAVEMRKAYKSEDPVEIAKKVLDLAGDYNEWISIVNRVNGFEDSFEDIEEEAKN